MPLPNWDEVHGPSAGTGSARGQALSDRPGGSVAASYTGRKEIRRDGSDHFAEVTVRGQLGDQPMEVTLSPAVLDYLREMFGADFEHQRHCVWAAVAVRLDPANRMLPEVLPAADRMLGLPDADVATFRAEVIGVRVSGNAGRKLAGFLLSVASMNAIDAYLDDWEDRHAKSSER